MFSKNFFDFFPKKYSKTKYEKINRKQEKIKKQGRVEMNDDTEASPTSNSNAGSHQDEDW